jgi:hypothetical protein
MIEKENIEQMIDEKLKTIEEGVLKDARPFGTIGKIKYNNVMHNNLNKWRETEKRMKDKEKRRKLNKIIHKNKTRSK